MVFSIIIRTFSSIVDWLTFQVLRYCGLWNEIESIGVGRRVFLVSSADRDMGVASAVGVAGVALVSVVLNINSNTSHGLNS